MPNPVSLFRFKVCAEAELLLVESNESGSFLVSAHVDFEMRYNNRHG